MTSLSPVYTNGSTYLIRKPRGIASSRGQQRSMLHLIQSSTSHPGVDVDVTLIPYFNEFLDTHGRTLVDYDETIASLTTQWSSDQEFGLLNRLDTPTGGFLTFAKDDETKQSFLSNQRSGTIKKYYLALVAGNPSYLIDHPEKVYGNLTEKVLTKKNGKTIHSHVDGNPSGSTDHTTINQPQVTVQDDTIHISTPLQHHRHLDDRMVAIKSDKDFMKGRDSLLQCTTSLSVIQQHEKNALVQCVITKGQRHQIRVHCQTLGYPIIGDDLYGKSKEGELELWSIGFSN